MLKIYDLIKGNRVVHIFAGNLGKANVNPPTVVDQDNFQMLRFTLNTDKVFLFWDLTVDYAGGDIHIEVEWTNDGGVDDQNKDIKVQLTYQIVSIGSVITGNHVNSPATVEDTYTSASGWIFNITSPLVIAEADLAGQHGIYLVLMFVTPAGVALTAEPHLIGIEIEYDIYINKKA